MSDNNVDAKLWKAEGYLKEIAISRKLQFLLTKMEKLLLRANKFQAALYYCLECHLMKRERF